MYTLRLEEGYLPLVKINPADFMGQVNENYTSQYNPNNETGFDLNKFLIEDETYYALPSFVDHSKKREHWKGCREAYLDNVPKKKDCRMIGFNYIAESELVDFCERMNIDLIGG